MLPQQLEKGKIYTGEIPDEDGALFELSKSGPELRLFFGATPDDMVACVERDPVWLGVLRHGDLGIVPWKIGERLQGDAQFHIFLYPPETRPTDQVLDPHQRFEVQLTLVNRASKAIRAVRRVSFSHELGVAFNDVLVHQLGNHIGREGYDAQVSGYQTEFTDLDTVIAGADRFERGEG